MGVLDTIEGTTLPTRSETLCLDAGLKAQHDQASTKLEEAAKQDAQFGSLAMEHTTAVVEEMDSLRDRMSASEVTFEFQALDWQKRLGLQAEHPPREDNLLDQARGFNVETFCPSLIRLTCLSVTGADGDRATKVPAKTWAKMFGRLNLGQFNQLYAAASATSDVAPSVPSSARFLLLSQDSEASLTPSGPGTSPRNGAAGGSRRTSPRSRTAKRAPAKKAGSSA